MNKSLSKCLMLAALAGPCSTGVLAQEDNPGPNDARDCGDGW
jgi:hypothetical protein